MNCCQKLSTTSLASAVPLMACSVGDIGLGNAFPSHFHLPRKNLNVSSSAAGFGGGGGVAGAAAAGAAAAGAAGLAAGAGAAGLGAGVGAAGLGCALAGPESSRTSSRGTSNGTSRATLQMRVIRCLLWLCC